MYVFLFVMTVMHPSHIRDSQPLLTSLCAPNLLFFFFPLTNALLHSQVVQARARVANIIVLDAEYLHNLEFLVSLTVVVLC